MKGRSRPREAGNDLLEKVRAKSRHERKGKFPLQVKQGTVF